MTDVAEIARGLTKAQKRALMAFDFPRKTFHTTQQGEVEITQWATAGELGVSGVALMSMNGPYDELTGGIGPILVTPDWGEGGRRYWSITDDGLEVRAHLTQEQPR